MSYRFYLGSCCALALTSLTASGCTDYGFNYPSDEGGGWECGNLDYPGEALSKDVDCLREEATATLPYIINWLKDDWGDDTDNFHYISSMPAVGQLNDDNGDGAIDDGDIADIVVLAYDTEEGNRAILRAVSGDGSGEELFDFDTNDSQARGGIALGDIDGDGYIEILSPTYNKRIVALEHDGTEKWESDSATEGRSDGEMDQLSLADLDGDGTPEILMGAAIFNADGELIGEGAEGIGGQDGTTPFGVDLDGDGSQEVVVGNALYDATGATIWANGEADGYPAVADFDDDGQGEIVVSNAGVVRLQDTDGSVIWSTTLDGADVSGPPTIGDFDGDGSPEIAVITRENLVALETDGSVLWSAGVTESSSGITSTVLFDFEQDGLPELLHGGEFTLQIIAANTGTPKLYTTEHSNETALEYPVIVDLEGDGQAEIISVSTPYENPNQGIRVFGPIDSVWPAARRTWNQHAWFLTNANDDGTIPATPETNWALHNNFRSGDLTPGTGLLSPDLVVQIVDVCEQECSAGNLVVWVQVGNQGLADSRETTVALYGRSGGDIVELSSQVIESVPSGEWLDALQIEVDVSEYQLWGIEAWVDGGDDVEGGGAWNECDESNNTSVWEDRFCE